MVPTRQQFDDQPDWEMRNLRKELHLRGNSALPDLPAEPPDVTTGRSLNESLERQMDEKSRRTSSGEGWLRSRHSEPASVDSRLPYSNRGRRPNARLCRAR